MTLRTRVVAIVTTLVIVGIGLASFVAYSATRRELLQSTDHFLQQRADEVLDGRRKAPASRNDGDATRPPDEQRLSFDPDVVTQTLNRSGRIGASSEAVLPVDAQDVAVAKGAAPAVRDIEIDGVTFRMVTKHDQGGGAVQVARDVSGTFDVLSALRLQLLAFGAMLAVIAALLGWLLMRRTTQPLEDLTIATERVTTSRDLTPLHLDRRDEVGRLANSFDRMLSALAVSREQQDRLVQDAAHELRTPLTSLRANIELLDRARNLPDDELDDLLGGLNSEVRELSQMFDELIQLATDANTREPDVEVELADVVDGAVDRFIRRTGRAVDVHTEPTVLVGNPTLLERAVTNLLGNAHKFSPADQPIEIELRNRRVVVRDHGPGVAVEDRDRVFDRFYRSDAARSKPGSGLGLAIVQQIAEQHGGTALVGEAPWGGAEISFSVA